MTKIEIEIKMSETDMRCAARLRMCEDSPWEEKAYAMKLIEQLSSMLEKQDIVTLKTFEKL